jgi:hypothetical protein
MSMIMHSIVVVAWGGMAIEAFKIAKAEDYR